MLAPPRVWRELGLKDDLRPLWSLVAAVAVGAIGWMAVAGLRLDWRSAMVPLGACLGLEALATLYRTRRPDPRLAVCLGGVSLLIAFSAVAACLSYAAAATAGPLQDARLLAADRALGFDWRAYLAVVNDTPGLGTLGTIAYQSLKFQLFLVVILLGFAGHLAQLRCFLLAFMGTTLVTILVSALMPAMAMYSALHLGPRDFANLDPAAAFVHVAAMTGLRDGTLRVIALDHMEGIITFPSLHAGLGVLLALAFSSVPWVRWPAAALNAALIAATPIDGGHYLSDVLAGALIAVLAHAIVAGTGRSIVKRQAHREPVWQTGSP